ncbi:MAG: ECF transporter S component [Oscillospiraceae bacterium]|jgi:uncharacterized membrane protein
MNTRKISFAAISAALIFAVTLLASIPLPGNGGAYLNLGDSIIYMTAFVLGGPVGAAAAAVGSCLADIAHGSVIYCIPTFFIKGIMGYTLGSMAGGRGFGRYAAAAVICGGIMTLGYALFEIILFGGAYAISTLPGNLIQWAGSVAVAFALYTVALRLREFIAKKL